MSKKLISSLVFLLVVSVFSVPANAASNVFTVDVMQTGHLGYRDAQGNPTGVHWDYVQAIAQRTGIKMKPRLVPKTRLIKDLKTGDTDGAIMFRSKKRDGYVTYAGMLREIKIVAINRKGKPLNTYNDLYHSKGIGVQKGTHLNPKFDADNRLIKYEVSNYGQMIKMLEKRRIDTATGNAIALANLLNKKNLSNRVEHPGIVLGAKEQWFHISNRSGHLDKTRKINKAIEELRAEGVLDKILTKHVGETWRKINAN
jgi:ABC-type amino acid transport substrate-binding protein